MWDSRVCNLRPPVSSNLGTKSYNVSAVGTFNKISQLGTEAVFEKPSSGRTIGETENVGL
jgi:hypothetical protein